MEVSQRAVILMPSDVEEVVKSDIPLSLKITRLWCIIMMDYQGTVGEEAGNRLRALIGEEPLSALMYISGFCLGSPDMTAFLSVLGKDIT